MPETRDFSKEPSEKLNQDLEVQHAMERIYVRVYDMWELRKDRNSESVVFEKFVNGEGECKCPFFVTITKPEDSKNSFFIELRTDLKGPHASQEDQDERVTFTFKIELVDGEPAITADRVKNLGTLMVTADEGRLGRVQQEFLDKYFNGNINEFNQYRIRDGVTRWINFVIEDILNIEKVSDDVGSDTVYVPTTIYAAYSQRNRNSINELSSYKLLVRMLESFVQTNRDEVYIPLLQKKPIRSIDE
jgi:hypothetical protein